MKKNLIYFYEWRFMQQSSRFLDVQRRTDSDVKDSVSSIYFYINSKYYAALD